MPAFIPPPAPHGKTSAALIIAGSALFSSFAFASGETVTVNTVADVVDFASPQQVAQLPGSDGKVSMREAVMAANNSAGPQTIAFAIPTSEWWLVSDMALLENEGAAWFVTDDFTTIDFTTQTVFTGDTNPDGAEVGVFGTHPSFLGQAAIAISADHCVVKGMGTVFQRGYGVDISGNANRVVSSSISGPLFAAVRITGGFGGPSSTGNIVGGTAPGEGNSLSSGNAGVRIDGPAENNIVIGNFLTGSAAGAEIRSATCCPGLEAIGNRIGGPTAAERNVIAGSGHYGEEGFPSGTMVSLEWAINTIVEGNYIGTTADGSAAFAPQRAPGGVTITNAPGSIVRNNLISGVAVNGTDHYAGQRFGIGVAIQGNSAGTVVEGNRIGTNAAGTAGVPNHLGVSASFWPGTQASGGVRVGGMGPGQGNVIAFNETVGALVQAVVNRVELSANSIHSNLGLGIDLMTFGSVPGAMGVTPNDFGDLDTGGNGLQNYPVLTSAIASVSSIQIAGTLSSSTSGMFRLEFFGSSVCDPTGFGEGRTFLGSNVVNTDTAGNASFDVTFPGASSGSGSVTATATNLATGDTSEFSACIAVTTTSIRADLSGDGHVSGIDLGMLLAAWGACSGKDPCPADLDGTGVVNGLDLAALLASWAP